MKSLHGGLVIYKGRFFFFHLLISSESKPDQHKQGFQKNNENPHFGRRKKPLFGWNSSFSLSSLRWRCFVIKGDFPTNWKWETNNTVLFCFVVSVWSCFLVPWLPSFPPSKIKKSWLIKKKKVNQDNCYNALAFLSIDGELVLWKKSWSLAQRQKKKGWENQM